MEGEHPRVEVDVALKVADSDVLIDYLKPHWPGRLAISDALTQGNLVTTTVTRFEVLRGALTSRAMRDALQLFSQMESLPLNDVAAETAAQIDRELRALRANASKLRTRLSRGLPLRTVCPC